MTSYKKPKSGTPVPKERVIAIDTEAKKYRRTLTTVTTQVHMLEETHLLHTKDSDYPFVDVLDLIFPQFAIEEENESRTKQRAKRTRKDGTTRRDGRRQTIQPIVCIFYNMQYDMPRLWLNHPQFMRQVLTCADSVRIQIGEYDVEFVSLLLDGGAPNFELYIRKDHKIMRLYGRDLWAYWKNGLDKTALSLLGEGKKEYEKENHDMTQEEFEALPEWERNEFYEYAKIDARLTRDSYLATVETLIQIDPVVVLKDGTIPVSGPAAAARIAFAMADDDEWSVPPQWTYRQGALTYGGARVFNRRSCRMNKVHCRDINSAYPHAMTLLPNPTTVEYRLIKEQDFNLETWCGQFGVMRVSGEGLDPLFPALRIHNTKHRRLQYVYGPFKEVWASIPEIVIGVTSGRLRIDTIHGGCHMAGSYEGSFLREFVLKVHRIKQSEKLAGRKESALSLGSKLLMNALYGKLAEVQLNSTWFPSQAMLHEVLCIPDITSETRQKEIKRAFAESGTEGLDELYDKWKEEFPDVTETDSLMNIVDKIEVPGKAGKYYLPMYAANITGFVSAKLGLAAYCTSAVQADTDSIFCEGEEKTTDLRMEEYRRLMLTAGYDCPTSGLGAFEVEGKTFERLDGTKITVYEAEGVFIKSKVYAMRYTYPGDPAELKPDKNGVVHHILYKAAKHGMVGLKDSEAWTVCSEHLLPASTYSYKSRKRPVTPKQAYKRRLSGDMSERSLPGFFDDHWIKVQIEMDPNQQLNENGEKVWKKFEE
jgi:hypothetical protein